MTDTQTGSDVQDNTSAILAIIGDGEDPRDDAADTKTDDTATAGATSDEAGDASQQESTEDTGDGAEGDAAPPEKEASGDDKGDELDVQSPAIEPPASWSADDKDAFKQLPPAAQQVIAKRESERERVVNQRLTEAADARKALEAQTAAVTQERQQLADQLKPAIERLASTFMEEFADIKSPADVERMAREDPGRKVLFDTKVQQLNQADATVRALEEANRKDAEAKAQANLAEQRKLLVEKWPDMGNPETSKKHGDRILDYLRAQGFKDEEMGRLASDHRLMLILRDAMTGIDLDKARKDAAAKADAAKKSVETKKVPEAARKVVKPGSATTASDSADKRAAALKQRALRTGRTDDVAAAILARIGD